MNEHMTDIERRAFLASSIMAILMASDATVMDFVTVIVTLIHFISAKCEDNPLSEFEIADMIKDLLVEAAKAEENE